MLTFSFARRANSIGISLSFVRRQTSMDSELQILAARVEKLASQNCRWKLICSIFILLGLRWC
jgi:hypothetical protein